MAEEYGMRTGKGEGPKREKRNSPRRLSDIHIEIGANGGHTVTHHEARRGEANGPYVTPKKHIFGPDDKDKLREHLHKHLGLGAAKAEAPEPGNEQDEDED